MRGGRERQDDTFISSSSSSVSNKREEMQTLMQMKRRQNIAQAKCKVTKITLAQVLNENNDTIMQDDDEEGDAASPAVEQVTLTLLRQHERDEDGYEESHLSK